MKKTKYLRKNFLNSQRGITLIALVVTVIVLLILAGVSLKLIAGGDGILGKAEKAVNLTNEAAALEKLNLKLVEYMADKVENAEVILGEYLESIDGCSEVRKDEVGSYIVTIDGYEFKVSDNGEVLGRLEKTTSPQTEIALEGKKVTVTMTERGEEITKLEIMDSMGNVLTTETKENMTQVDGKYVIEYTFADQGSYTVVVTTATGETYTKEVVIDLNPPAEPVISSNYGYPVLTSIGVKLDGTTKIEYDTTVETENYYSFDGTNWQKYEGEFQAQEGTIYAKSVKKSNGMEATVSKPIGIPSDALKPEGYDGNESTGGGRSRYIMIDESVVGKKVRLITCSEGPNVYLWDADKKSYKDIGQYRKNEYIFEMPEGVKYISVYDSWDYGICEIGLYDE